MRPPASIILAAGLSSRMKESGRGVKALLEIRPGVTFLEEIYRKVRPLSDKVIVVLGLDRDEIVERVNIPQAEIAYNADFEKGMFSSLKKALSMLDSGEAFMLTPVDCPAVKQSTYEALIRQWEKEPERIHICSFKGRRGHPAIYPALLVEEILASPDDTPGGLRFFLQREAALVSLFDTDDKGAIIDVDASAEYEDLAEELKGQK